MTGRVHRVATENYRCGFRFVSGLTEGQAERIEINKLSLIVPRVIRLSQDFQKGVMECNKTGGSP